MICSMKIISIGFDLDTISSENAEKLAEAQVYIIIKPYKYLWYTFIDIDYKNFISIYLE